MGGTSPFVVDLIRTGSKDGSVVRLPLSTSIIAWTPHLPDQSCHLLPLAQDTHQRDVREYHRVDGRRSGRHVGHDLGEGRKFYSPLLVRCYGP